MNDLRKLVLIYRDEAGNLHEQRAEDLPNCGTLIDPDNGDDMELVGWRVVE